jgi:hypothetical protein
MANIIEVEWEAKPKAGNALIDLSDMGFTLKQWNKLSSDVKEKHINEYLKNNEEEIVPKFVEYI